MGGWVGGRVDFIPIIKPLRGPTCKLKTSKISTQVEVASWARVWQKCAPMKILNIYHFHTTARAFNDIMNDKLSPDYKKKSYSNATILQGFKSSKNHVQILI